MTRVSVQVTYPTSWTTIKTSKPNRPTPRTRHSTIPESLDPRLYRGVSPSERIDLLPWSWRPTRQAFRQHYYGEGKVPLSSVSVVETRLRSVVVKGDTRPPKTPPNSVSLGEGENPFIGLVLLTKLVLLRGRRKEKTNTIN